jgi:hypothetical protein
MATPLAENRSVYSFNNALWNTPKTLPTRIVNIGFCFVLLITVATYTGNTALSSPPHPRRPRWWCIQKLTAPPPRSLPHIVATLASVLFVPAVTTLGVQDIYDAQAQKAKVCTLAGGTSFKLAQSFPGLVPVPVAAADASAVLAQVSHHSTSCRQLSCPSLCFQPLAVSRPRLLSSSLLLR